MTLDMTYITPLEKPMADRVGRLLAFMRAIGFDREAYEGLQIVARHPDAPADERDRARTAIAVLEPGDLDGIETSDGWLDFESAPRDGHAFLASGIHDTDNGRSWRKGDQWQAILLWNVWQEPGGFVFSKDGAQPWSRPLKWRPLPPFPVQAA